jgi:sphingomyelin phosphodiesterase
MVFKNGILILIVYLTSITVHTQSGWSTGQISEPENIEIEKTLQNELKELMAMKGKQFLFGNKFGEDGYLCSSCLSSVNKLYNVMSERHGLQGFLKAMGYICSFIESNELCDGLFSLYGQPIYDDLMGRLLNADIVCSKLYLCDKHYTELTVEEFAKELFDSQPKSVKDISDKYSDAPELKILHVSDIHTDLKYQVGSLGRCNTKFCCRSESGVPQSPEDAAGEWGYSYMCDLPVKTLERFVEVIATEIKPDLILWTGDNPPHDIWKESQEEVFNVTKIFVDLLKKYGYTNPVYPVLGNHDKFPIDLYKPGGESQLLKELGDIFKPWLTDDSYATFTKYGYYVQKHPNSNLKVVGLNSMLCDLLNFELIRNPTDPDSGFTWLIETLREAEAEGESVYMIGHMPIGDRFQSYECTKRFQVVMTRFSSVIRGNFYGHTHHDEFRLIKSYQDSNIVFDLMYIAPSLTT